MPHIVLIAAVGKNRAIGRGGKLPWRLADDLKRFKALTTGHAVLMGRKTFASLSHGALPLRRNLVLSRRRKDFPGAETFPTLEAALAAAGEGTVFAIGGESVYREAMPLVEKLYLTRVLSHVEGDVFFPEWNDKFQKESEESFPADEKNDFPTTFEIWVRKK